MDKEEFCKFSFDGEDVHVNIQGMTLEQVAGVVGVSLNDYLVQTMKGKTYGESKKEALDLCHRFCNAMRIDVQDLNPWHPISKIPYHNKEWQSPILISNNVGEQMCVGYYDDRNYTYHYSDGEIFEDAVWWKRIQDLPQPPAFYNKVIMGEE